MCIKKISDFFRFELFREMKMMKLLLIVPIIIIDILIPIYVYEVSQGMSDVFIINNLIKYNQIIIPISSLIWTFMILNNRYSGEGSEIFDVYGSNSICVIMFALVIQNILIIASYAYCKTVVDISFLECTRVMIISFMVNAILYFLATVTKNSITAILVTICYIVANIVVGLVDGLKINNIFVFYQNSVLKESVLWNKYIYYIVLGIILFGASALIKKKKI